MDPNSRSDWARHGDLEEHRSTRKLVSIQAVLCTFAESASPTEGNPDTFWSIHLHRGPSNGWLIDNYGQPCEIVPGSDSLRRSSRFDRSHVEWSKFRRHRSATFRWRLEPWKL